MGDVGHGERAGLCPPRTQQFIFKCVVCSVALYAAETWMLTQSDRRRLKAFAMWIWRRMGKITWLDKVINE